VVLGNRHPVCGVKRAENGCNGREVAQDWIGIHPGNIAQIECNEAVAEQDSREMVPEEIQLDPNLHDP